MKITKTDYARYCELASLQGVPMPFDEFVKAVEAERDKPLHSYRLNLPKDEHGNEQDIKTVQDLRSGNDITTAKTEAGKQHIAAIKESSDSEMPLLKETPKERFERFKKEWWAILCDKVGKPILTAHQRKAIAYIIAWFARLERFEFVDKATSEATAINVELRTGLWICGGSGTGKTTTVEILQKVTRLFSVVSMRALAIECLNDGDLTPVTSRIKNKVYCIDDVGAESRVKIYGNDIEAFSELVMLYEQQSRNNGLPMIVTSNIIPRLPSGEPNPDFVQRYGERETNRVLSLFKIIYFDGDKHW